MASYKKIVVLFLSLLNVSAIFGMRVNPDRFDNIAKCLICKKNSPTLIVFPCGMHSGHPACIYIEQHFEYYVDYIPFHCPGTDCGIIFNNENMHKSFLNEINAYLFAEYKYSNALLKPNEHNEDPETYLIKIPRPVAEEIKKALASHRAMYEDAALEKEKEQIARFSLLEEEEELEDLQYQQDQEQSSVCAIS